MTLNRLIILFRPFPFHLPSPPAPLPGDFRVTAFMRFQRLKITPDIQQHPSRRTWICRGRVGHYIPLFCGEINRFILIREQRNWLRKGFNLGMLQSFTRGVGDVLKNEIQKYTQGLWINPLFGTDEEFTGEWFNFKISFSCPSPSIARTCVWTNDDNLISQYSGTGCDGLGMCLSDRCLSCNNLRGNSPSLVLEFCIILFIFSNNIIIPRVTLPI